MDSEALKMSLKMAREKYDAANTRQYKMKLNINTDSDIIQKLEQVSNEPGGKQGYIKALIRADIHS